VVSSNKPAPSPGDSDSLRVLIATIACGIAKRRFHIANGVGLQPLWGDSIVCFREMLRRLQSFAETREWEVPSKDWLALVLFQPMGGAKLLSGGSWLGKDR
jgi:hypothetical protein